MTNQLIVLSKHDVMSVLTMKDIIEAMRIAVKDHSAKKTQMVKRSYLFPSKGRIGVMSAYVESLGTAGTKVVSTFHENPIRYNLPSITALIVLNDIDTGQPIAVMDGGYITTMRTGAMSALATEYLAKTDSKIAGIIGLGEQGKGQLLGLAEVLDLEKVYVFDIDKTKMKAFSEAMGKETDLDIIGLDSIEMVVRKSDVLATTTPSKTPIVFEKWVGPGLHINTVGGASRGEQEIDTHILKRSKLVVDDFENASTRGCITGPISNGDLSKEDVYAELGDVVSGKKPGRTSSDELTVFVSSGLPIQDIAAAQVAIQKAEELGLGKKMSMF